MSIDEVTPEVVDPDDEDAAAEVEAAGLRDVRLGKVAELRERGIDPYPNKYDIDTTIGGVREQFGELATGEETDHVVHVAGRVMLIRSHGKLLFASLRDRSGEIQLFCSEGVMGEDEHRDFVHLVDRGDWIGVRGTVMVTRTGELSIKVDEFRILAKSLRPLPDKWKGLTDTDVRYRQRYLDLISRDDTRRTFEIRFKAIEGIRDHLRSLGYFEVETPALSLIQGGATARPFITHYNALNIDSYLRIALELPLKRLIVGGLEKVFEIGRVFRNEGMSTRHNPEFTMIEAYEAFADYKDMMQLTEDLVVAAARAALGTSVIKIAGKDVDLAQPWRKATMVELVKEHSGADINPSMPVEQARRVLDEHGVHYEDEWGSGKLLVEMYDAFVEENLIEPTFVIDHPREVSPLAKAKPDDPTLTERFELVVEGRELANAYSELNDPIDQLERFEDEARAKAHGDPEAGDIDYDYVRALEYGLPPTGGLGIGIDRLIMLLAGVDTIREVLLFPTLRPEQGEDDSVKEAAKAERDKIVEHRRPVALRGSPKLRTPWRVRCVALLTALTGLFYLFALSPTFTNVFGTLTSALVPRSLERAGSAVTVLIGIVLLYLSTQLRRRKKRAWALTTVMYALGAFVNLVKDFDLDHISVGIDDTPEILALVMLAILLITRKDFDVIGDPPSWVQAVRFVPTYLAVILVFGFAALFSQRTRMTPDLTVGGALVTIVGGLFGFSGPYTYENEHFAAVFPKVLVVMGVIGLIVFAILAFRPIVARQTRSENDRTHAEKLVRDYGSDTLAPFTLRPDKTFFFSSDGKAMIAFAYLGRTALVSADPVGAPGSVDLVLDEFLEYCEQHGWDVAFLAVRDDTLDRYHARGLHSFYLGDEALIDCRRFTLEGPAMKAVRQANNRVATSSDFSLIKESEADEDLIRTLNEISARWRKGNDERGFTMTLSEDVTGERSDFLLAIARDKTSGRVQGFLRIVPAYGDKELSYTLDLMRHDNDAPNGMTEFLTSQTAMALKGKGVSYLSMNFAAWGQLWQDNVDFTFGMRIMKWFVEKLNPYFQIKSLYEFNEKFDPDWLPRSMVCTSPTALPKVGVLFGGVEGFVELPLVHDYLVPKVVDTAHAPASV